MEESCGSERTPTEHLLITVLGMPPMSARYSWDGQVGDAMFAPVALLDLLPAIDRPDRVLAVCTPEAEAGTFPRLEEALEGVCPVEAVSVHGAETPEDIDEFLRRLTRAVPQGDHIELTVDLTHGFRHFAFLTYMAVLYLTALRGVRLRGAYYGILGGRGEISPLVDVRPLLELPRWFHAVEVLGETGSALPMAKILDETSGDQEACGLSREMRRLSEAYMSGLPLAGVSGLRS
jgi:CRISPR-associated DxTHG motif protein